MQGKLGNSQVKNYALGITPQSSVYGSTIPVIYGRTRAALFLTWAANMRKAGGSSKAIKAKKGSPPTYAEDVTMLLGHNPIAGVLQFWQNQNQKLPLNFSLQQFTIHDANEASVTITDPQFYFLLAVTLTIPYSATFNDYGGQGSVSLSGNYELPLWNAAYAGSNRVDAGGWRFYPFIFRWSPWSGDVIDIDVNAKGQLLGPLGLASATLTAYYAQIPGTGHIPLADLRLTFESELGDGPEYADANLTSQQIFYPPFAGVGSPNIDLGSTQAIPNIVAEVVGAFPVYASGDADYADMIEDIFRGVAQAAFTQNTQLMSYSNINHGLDCYEFPGAIQKKLRTSSSAFTTALFDLPVTAFKAGYGGIMIVVARNDSGAHLNISDTRGSTWARMLQGGPYNNMEVWYAATPSSGPNTVTVTPSGANTDFELIELAGIDTVSSIFAAANSVYVSGTNGPITGTITLSAGSLPYRPAYLLAVVIAETGAANIQPSTPPTHWQNLMVGQGKTFSMYRLVNAEGAYSFSVQPTFTGNWHLLLVAFTNSQAVSWPAPRGEIIEPTTMQLVRNQCRANGLFGSLALDTQRKGSDPLEELYKAANAAPVWSGFSLKSIPKSEVSAVGNGAVYIAPTAGGPVANLQIADFSDKTGDSWIQVDRTGQVDRPNVVQMQHPNRDSDYNDVVTTVPEPAATANLGVRRPDSPTVMRCVQDVNVALPLLGIQVRDENYVKLRTYKFQLKAKWKLLEPMDLVTLPTDEESGISGPLPVRMTSIQENDKYDLDCEAEPFIYGVHAPQPVAVGTPNPYQASTTYIPLEINAPVIFEPTGQLAGFPNINELWLLISDSDTLYGGCDVYVSTDGGASYNFADTIFGNATTGVLLSDWPQAADPDETNDLSVNLTESLGVLLSRTAADKDNFVYPCYVASKTSWTDLASVAGTKIVSTSSGGFSPAMVGQQLAIASGTHFVAGSYLVATFTDANHITLATDPTDGSNASGGVGSVSGQTFIPYEIMSYGTVSLIAAHEYDMHAASGGVVWLRRGVAGCPLPQQGVDHPTGSRFAFLDPSMLGWGVISLDPGWIGKPLFFKFAQFNQYGGGKQQLNNLPAYSFTPTGLTQASNVAANSVNYSLSPRSPLSEGTPSLIMPVLIAQTIVQFPTGQVTYQARNFLSIAASENGKRQYVSIYDPNYTGDYGAAWSDLSTTGAGQFIVQSTLGGFNASMIDQLINITSGTNFNPGQYAILQVIDAHHALLQTSPTPSGAGSGGVGGLLLSVIVEETPNHVGLRGYTYLGSIYPDIVSAANAIITPGGFPIPSNISINGTLIG